MAAPFSVQLKCYDIGLGVLGASATGAAIYTAPTLTTWRRENTSPARRRTPRLN
jgi:hypothetical protein